MFFSASPIKKIAEKSFIWLAAVFVSVTSVSETQAKIVFEKSATFGVIKGIVRDEQGNPISGAAVAVFRVGASKALKQVYSAANGSFLAKVIPGTYTVLAVAQGFNAITLEDVQVARAAELNYGFKLEKVGGGNTLPDKKLNRNSSEWRIKMAQSRRSIYQHQEGKIAVGEEDAAAGVEEIVGSTDDEKQPERAGQTVVETYFAETTDGSYQGLNFASLQPIGENSEIIFAGQTGIGDIAPSRLELSYKTRRGENHQIRLTTSAAKFGKIQNVENNLGQISFQALDEWKVKDGVILVLGFDYSKFVGAGDDSAISPRFGLQFDIDAKTRFRTAYTMQTEDRDWSNVVELENSAVAFRSQSVAPVVAVENFKPKMNKSRRMEFGVERVLDNNSSIETTAFFDTVTGRGVGLTGTPFSVLNADEFAPYVVSQEGNARGVRMVYTRRFGKIFSGTAGYSFGRGQKISPGAASNSANIFENGSFQSFVGQINAELKTGTQIKTIFRLSPQATVFAIDPFQGRLAIYDPGLSVLVTQPLPTLGLPIHAEAILDARNVFDLRNEQGSIQLDSQRRMFRGGIMVRF
jgi:hypothetical protein